MKKITIQVDDDVEYIEVDRYYTAFDAKVVPDIHDESFNELDVWHVRIHRKLPNKSDIANKVYITGEKDETV